MSPAGPNQLRRDETPTKIDQRVHKSLTKFVSCGYTYI